MSYIPTDIPSGRGPEFKVWLTDELRKVAQAFDQLDNLDLVPLNAEPSKFAEGLIVYADGSGFDPGFGSGPYYRSGGGWVKMADTGGGAGVTSFAARVGAVVPLVGDYAAFYAPLVHTHLEADITDLQPYLLDAPSDGNDYGRRDGAWEIIPTGGVTDHGALTGLADDDHTQYALLAGRAGGQTLIGGTAAGDDLTLVGTSGALAGARVNMNSPVEFGAYQPTGAAYGFNYSAAETFTSNFVGGGLNFSGTINFTNSTFIYESFRGAPTITTGVNPGFAAYTVLQALPRFNAGAGSGHNPLAPLIVNAGPRVNNAFAGTRTTATMAGMNFAPTVGAELSGAIMNVTSITGLIVAPKWDTHAGATIGLGTIRGVHCQNPAQGLFQTSAGVEGMTAYIGVDINAIPFGGNVTKVGLRSALTQATNTFLIQNTGGADSEFGGGNIHFDDNTQVLFGNGGFVGDVGLRWNGAASTFDFLFASFLDHLAFSSPGADRFLIGSNANAANELAFDFRKIAFGQTGAVGNQKMVFAAGSEIVTVGGEYAQYLLTQSANDTIDAALGLYAGWSINAPSPVIGTGSLTAGVGLNIAGNPATASQDRVGLRILSNPSGGSGVNAALWITAGLAQLDGDLAHGGTNLGFYGTTPIAQQTSVPVTIAAVHAALVALGLIT